MVIALTGAHTFLGSQLIDLAEGHGLGIAIDRVLVLDLEPPARSGALTRFVRVDLTQPAAQERVAEVLARERVDAFVHMAFLSRPLHDEAWAHEFEAIGTLHVLNACSVAGVRKFVTRTPTAIYGAHSSNPAFLPETAPLRGAPRNPWVQDKIEVERQVDRFRAQHPEAVVTVLRMAPTLGPDVGNFMTRYLTRPLVPTLLGHDPLFQFLHQDDAAAALQRVVSGDYAGTFNIVPDGVLPLHRTLVELGRRAVPVPHFAAVRVLGMLWAAQVTDLPPGFLDYLRYSWVADGDKARRELRFVARHTTLEAVRHHAAHVLRSTRAAA